MSRAIALLLLACLGAEFAYGMDCSLSGDSNFLSKLINSCPGPLDSSEKSFCCYDVSNKATYCCTADEFAVKIGFEIIIPLVIAAIVVISLIVCCISCLFCSCCPWYRRHQGTVYGKVHAPCSVHVVRTPAINQLPPPASQTVYATNSIGIPPQPPQYTNEMYPKQAPYNPNYPGDLNEKRR